MDQNIASVTEIDRRLDGAGVAGNDAVELQPNLGTKIRNFINKTGTDADLLEPVRA